MKPPVQIEKKLLFLPLGGCGEIGMNLNCYGYQENGKTVWFIADLGVTFGEKGNIGMDVTMPDPFFIQERAESVLGIVLTHAHEDHIGAVAHLWNYFKCPVYATPFTANMLTQKFIEKDISRDNIRLLHAEKPFDLGPFKLELIPVTHSTLESCALFIETPLGNIFHTGDFKIDPGPVLGPVTALERIREVSKKGVIAMVCDSTNVFQEGTSGSEEDLAQSLDAIVCDIRGTLVVATFASNLARLLTFARLAQKTNRNLLVAGRSMYRAIDAAMQAGYLENFPTIYREESWSQLDPLKTMILCTGSQGEPRAALSRIAHHTHRHIHLSRGDSVLFSSRIIPGNERSIFALQNALARQGVNILTEKDHFIHVSGHPCREELDTLYNSVTPDTIIPVHGEARHLLEHAAFARSKGINAVVPSNGSLIQLAPDKIDIVEHVEAGRLHVDGKILVNAKDVCITERERLACNGWVCLHAFFHAPSKKRSLQRKGPLTVLTRGVPQYDEHGQSLEENIKKYAENLFKEMDTSNLTLLKKRLEKTLSSYLWSAWGKRPFLDIFLIIV